MDLFLFKDYKGLLRTIVEENRPTRGYLTRLAASAGCQPSFLSQVLHSHAHLTPDHAAGIAHALGFTELESDYFLELLLLERAGSSHLRKLCQRRLEKMRSSRADLNVRLATPVGLAPDVQSVIYSAWHWLAIYVLVSIPDYKSPQEISRRLGLSTTLVQGVLRSLEGFHLIRKTESGWQLTERNIHLPRDSHLTSTNHLNWRFRAITKIQEQDEGAFHYTAVQTLSRDDYERLKAMFLTFIQETREIVRSSPEEEIVCMALDFFRL